MIRVRPARMNELAFLQAKHSQVATARGYEQLDLSKSVVFIAEDDVDGMRCGMLAARLVWQLEPLILFPEFERTSSPMSKRRATYALARAFEKYLGDPTQNRTGLRFFFAVIENVNQRMQHAAENFGWRWIYRKTKVFGKDV